MEEVTEKQLVLPSLYLMNIEDNGYISTPDLIKNLEQLIKPTGNDLDILKGRKDTKFSQKVRNLKSHNTLLRNNLATHEGLGFKLTIEGKEYLIENMDIIEYLIENDFERNDMKKGLGNIYKSTIENTKKVETFDENIFINEGINKIKKSKVYVRSLKLRDFAISKFTKNDGKLYCEACNFSYDLFYGEELSGNYIEIHHKKPVFKYKGEDLEKSIENALANLAPVCASCHRMIHRRKTDILEIKILKENINNNGIYNKK